MQFIIRIIFLFAPAMCNSTSLHLNPNVSTETKEEFAIGSEQNSSDLNQEILPAIYNRSLQLSNESKNKVPMNKNENLNEAAEPSIQSPIETKLKNIITAEEKEKNEVPSINHNINQDDLKSNQTTDSGVMPDTLPQVEASPTSTCNSSIKWPECTNPSNALEDVSRELTRFTVELYKKLSSRDEDSNIVIAPFSIALGLSQLMLGSTGKTREEMLRIMYGGMKDTQCVHSAIWNLTKHNSFVSANEIFFSKDISLKEEFTNQSKRFYESKGTKLKQQKDLILKQINRWVSEKTNQLIKTMFKELPDIQLMLINVIYYQGKWMNRFDAKRTTAENFQTATGSTVRVPMMNNNKYPLQSIRDTNLQAQVARLPLTDNCSLLIFLPLSQEKHALKNVESLLTEENVNLLMKQLQEKSPRSTSVSFPKLKLNSDFGLSETLSSLGLYDLFQNPDFCALSDSIDLAVSDVRHRAVLEIKEDGAKAAAASSVTVARTMLLFSVQRPFLFILANEKNKIPIVIGRVTDPSN